MRGAPKALSRLYFMQCSDFVPLRLALERVPRALEQLFVHILESAEHLPEGEDEPIALADLARDALAPTVTALENECGHGAGERAEHRRPERIPERWVLEEVRPPSKDVSITAPPHGVYAAVRPCEPM